MSLSALSSSSASFRELKAQEDGCVVRSMPFDGICAMRKTRPSVKRG